MQKSINPPPYDHDHENDIVFFGMTNFRNQLKKFGIKTDDRRRHMYVIGKTGVGKTTLMENMVLADIWLGHGVGVVDPHGDFAEKIIDFIPKHRINDVVYFNPADVSHPVSFNILESLNPDHKHLIASGLMGVFKKIWPDVWSARMEHIMNMCLLSLLESPGNTLLGINRILVDRDFRRKIIVGLRDPVVKSFWITEFEQWQERFRTEAIAPIQNKVGQFLSTSVIRNIVGQKKSTIKAREIMDSRKILIINLAKGRVGEDASRLLGGMLITKMQLAAMERVDMKEEDRQDFFLYIDEFQNFATESFANILSEARKYRLALIMAHQYIEQLEETVAAAVFGNVGTLCSFRVGAADSEKLATEFAPRFTEEDLVNLPKYNVYLKLMIDGIASDPFSALTLPPIDARTGSTEVVVEASRRQFGRDRAVVEKEILDWSETRPNLPEGVLPEIPKGKPPKRLHEYDCTRCNKHMILPVELDRNRPIYCEDCIEIVRAEKKAGTYKPPKIKKKEVAEGSRGKQRGAERTKDKPDGRLATGEGQPKVKETEVVEKPVGSEMSLSDLSKESEEAKGSKGEQRRSKETKGSEEQKRTTGDERQVADDKSKKKRRRRRKKKHSDSGGGQVQKPKPSSPDEELFPW